MKLYFKKSDDGESLELKLLTYFEIHLERKNNHNHSRQLLNKFRFDHFARRRKRNSIRPPL